MEDHNMCVCTSFREGMRALQCSGVDRARMKESESIFVSIRGVLH